ncbi:uncharacterized protein YdcI-like isoform X2 [Arctopsyche grandis]
MPPKKRSIGLNDDKSPISNKRPRKNETIPDKPPPTKRKAPIKIKPTKKPSKKKSNANDKDGDSSLSEDDCMVIDESGGNRQDPISIDSDDDNIDNHEDETTENGEFPMWDNAEVLADISGIRFDVAQNIVQLINEENTLPFIARYRKAMIDYMSPECLQDVFDSYEDVCKLKRKSLTILKTLKKSDKLTDQVQQSVIGARSIDELELLYEPFKTRTKTLAERAYNLGLREPIQSILKGRKISIESLCNSAMKTPSDVQQHLIHGLADVIHKDPDVLETIRKLRTTMVAIIECSKARATKKKTVDSDSSSTSKLGSKKFKNENKENARDKYDLYLNFRMKSDIIKPHQTLAINRGEAEKVLSVKTIISDQFFEQFSRFCSNKWSHELIQEAAADAYKRFFQPWLVRKVRSEMTTKAIKVSISLFCTNLKRLLLTSPIKNHNIIGIDPGFAAGCKVAIIGFAGQPLETFVLHPNFRKTDENFNDTQAASLCYFIEKYHCEVIALGDGTACRETEFWLRNIDEIKHLPLVIVPEQGASIYSCSPEAAKEFPNMDPNLISAISLARRALDPLSELIKVNPKHIGVGMYQHDVPPKLLTEALNNVTINCVSFVGADLNTSSQTLLVKVAGLTETKVKNILKYREKHGEFQKREELLKITGIGPKTYKQCAGFLRVPNSKNKLDNTWIHPESYDLAIKFLNEIDVELSDLGLPNFTQSVKQKVSYTGISTLACILNCAESDIELFTEALSQSSLDDPLRNVNPVYSMSISSKNQLAEGATLTGVVRNVTSFGIFVDCGVGQNGLIHNSKIGNSRHPQLGDKVSVMVIPPLTANRIPLKLLKII